jgi:hypothetical protein
MVGVTRMGQRPRIHPDRSYSRRRGGCGPRSRVFETRMTFIRAFVVGATLVAIGAPSALPSGPLGDLHGTVVRGPITPVCRLGVSCDAPAANVVLTFTGAGVVRVTHTNSYGVYRVELPAGTYSVRTSSSAFGRIPLPATVRVRGGQSGKVNFMIDTGIR